MDWNLIKNEAITHLQNLIRINTTNPPGNELEAVTYLSSVLKKDGIDAQIFESTPGRANLVARLKGNGLRKPLLLTSHVDVVPAEKENWEVDPFSGEIKDGFLWGRGAIDMKQMTVMELMMFLLAKRNKISLSRDLILAAVANEEMGCRFGSEWLVENKPELIRAEFALNEIGGFSLPVEGHIFYPIGVTERGVCWFKIISRGDSGHGSLPHDNQATVKLAKVVDRLGQAELPFHSHPVVRQFISQMASRIGFPKKWALKGLLIPSLNSFILRRLMPDKKKARQFYSLFHNTVSPTIFRSGSKINVIPAKAEVEVDGRIIPGQSVSNFLAEVQKIIGSDFEIEVLKTEEPPQVSDQNDFFDLLGKALKNNDERAIPVPYIMPGFTDASQYSRLGIKCYGFAPVQLQDGMNFSDLFHGVNERIPIEGFMFGIKVLWDVVRNA